VRIYKKKIIVGTIVSLFFVATSINAVMYVLQPDMVYFPTRTISQTPDQWGLEYEDVYLSSSNQNKIHGWYLPAKNSKQSLVFFHGNGGNISHRGDSLKIFNRLGFNILIIDYQGYGKSEGSADEAAMYDDAQAAWKYLREVKKFKQSEIVIFGRSLGGAVASKLALDVEPQALILESTFSSISDMAKLFLPEMSKFIYFRYEFNTLQRITSINVPLLMLHSRADKIIPFELGKKVYEAANKPKIFIEMVGDHNSGFLQSQPGYEQAIGQFINLF
jgi:fermentation-respiration switch protein FrsA (DUF1100 family)